MRYKTPVIAINALFCAIFMEKIVTKLMCQNPDTL